MEAGKPARRKGGDESSKQKEHQGNEAPLNRVKNLTDHEIEEPIRSTMRAGA